jgi:hypothetical protein
MPHTSAPRRQMETRASNKTAHPGYVDKVIPTRRSGVEVQKTRTAKAQAKAAREEAKKNSINRTAEFELADIAKENLADATPRPLFTPKARNRTYPDLTPLAATSDVEEATDFDKASFVQARSEMSATGDDSAAESDATTLPPLKQTTQSIGKATKARKKQVEEPDVEVIPSDTEPLQVPKRKKKKMVRNEINIAAKNIEGDKYGDMVRADGEPAFKATGGYKKKKEAAVAASFDQEANSDQAASKPSKQNKDGIDEM